MKSADASQVMFDSSLLSTMLGTARSSGQPAELGGQSTDAMNGTAISVNMTTGIATTATTEEEVYETTEDPDPEDLKDMALQIGLALSPFVIGGICFLYRYLYVSRNLRLARRPGDSDPPSSTNSSEERIDNFFERIRQNGTERSLASALAATVPGVAGASIAPVASVESDSKNCKPGEGEEEDKQSTTSTPQEENQPNEFGSAPEFGHITKSMANFRTVYSQYSTAACFSNFTKK